MSAKIAVIGSNSFSGAHFVDGMLLEGSQVLGISRSEPPSPAFLPYLNNPSVKNFSFAKLDINSDLDRIMGRIEDFQPEYVVNFAAQSMVAESWTNPEHWFQTNCVGQIKFHDRLRSLKFLKKYVHVSTPEVYGSCKGAVAEDAPYNPSTPYAASRAAADLSLMTFKSRYGFPVAFTRAANVYGPGQQLYRILPRAILFSKLGRKLDLHGGGHSTRSFIHIKDVVDGTARVMRDAEPGEIYHLSTPKQISIRELVALVADRMGVSFAELVNVVDDRPGKDAAYWLDSARAKAKFGWTPQIDLDRGVRETIAWANDNFEELKRQPFDYIHKA